MNFNPVATLKCYAASTTRDLDESLCLICEERKKESLVKNKKGDRIQDILNQCKEHNKYNTGKYKELNSKIRHKSVDELKRCSYHYSCSQTFATNYNYVRRAKSIGTAELQNVSSSEST